MLIVHKTFLYKIVSVLIFTFDIFGCDTNIIKKLKKTDNFDVFFIFGNVAFGAYGQNWHYSLG